MKFLVFLSLVLSFSSIVFAQSKKTIKVAMASDEIEVSRTSDGSTVEYNYWQGKLNSVERYKKALQEKGFELVASTESPDYLIAVAYDDSDSDWHNCQAKVSLIDSTSSKEIHFVRKNKWGGLFAGSRYATHLEICWKAQDKAVKAFPSADELF